MLARQMPNMDQVARCARAPRFQPTSAFPTKPLTRAVFWLAKNFLAVSRLARPKVHRLQMLFKKCAARRRFQIPLKLCCVLSIRKRNVSFQTPRPPLLRVKLSPRVVGIQPHRQIIGQPCVEPSRIHFALEDVYVSEFCHGLGLPSRSSPR